MNYHVFYDSFTGAIEHSGIFDLFSKILFTNPSSRAGYDTWSIFKWSLTGLNSQFSFSLTSCLNKAEESSLSYYLPIAGGRIIGFIPFPRVLVQCEMQSVSSTIWTRVAVFISYDDNHYHSPKSLYKKTSQEILAELKAGFKTGASNVQETPTRPTQPVTTQLSGACQQTAITDTRRHQQEEGREET